MESSSQCSDTRAQGERGLRILCSCTRWNELLFICSTRSHKSDRVINKAAKPSQMSLKRRGTNSLLVLVKTRPRSQALPLRKSQQIYFPQHRGKSLICVRHDWWQQGRCLLITLCSPSSCVHSVAKGRGYNRVGDHQVYGADHRR